MAIMCGQQTILAHKLLSDSSIFIALSRLPVCAKEVSLILKSYRRSNIQSPFETLWKQRTRDKHTNATCTWALQMSVGLEKTSQNPLTCCSFLQCPSSFKVKELSLQYILQQIRGCSQFTTISSRVERVASCLIHELECLRYRVFKIDQLCIFFSSVNFAR